MKPIRTAAEALTYLVDCELATLCHYLYKKSSPKSVKGRHAEIAANGAHAVTQYGPIPIESSYVGHRYTSVREQLPQPTMQFASSLEALAYMTTEAEKTLAILMGKKSSPASEIRRYESIAKTGHEFLAKFSS